MRARFTERYDISRLGYEVFEKKKFRKNIREGQKFVKEVYNNIGPDLYASTFILTRGGNVKFMHDDIWYSETTASNIPVPPKDEGYRVEGIDAADMIIMLEGLDSLRNLKYLRYLRLKKMFELEDWHLFLLHKFESLEFLDISDNPRLTDKGMQSLYRLRNLKVLDISNCQSIEHGELVSACLQQLNPDLTVMGLDPEHSLQEDLLKETYNSRFLTLGSSVTGDEVVEDSEESLLQTQPGTSAKIGDKRTQQPDTAKDNSHTFLTSFADRIRKAMFTDAK